MEAVPEASCGWYGKHPALTVSGKGDACLQIVACKVGEIFEDFCIEWSSYFHV
jgi:hypothetical protein